MSDSLSSNQQDTLLQITAERDAALAHSKRLATEVARLERQLIAEQDHDELLLKAHARLLQLRPGWPESDHGAEPGAAEIERLRAALDKINTLACYASEENTDTREAALLEIGKLARGEVSQGIPILAPVIWQIMYRLADLLDSDQFNNIEAIVQSAGVPFPPEGYEGRPADETTPQHNVTGDKT